MFSVCDAVFPVDWQFSIARFSLCRGALNVWIFDTFLLQNKNRFEDLSEVLMLHYKNKRIAFLRDDTISHFSPERECLFQRRPFPSVKRVPKAVSLVLAGILIGSTNIIPTL